MKISDRFMQYVPSGVAGCWEWEGGRTGAGYGAFWLDGKTCCAHRVSYEIHKGPIPEGMFLDHLCRNPPCVNPDHLEPVTPAENMRRGPGSKPECIHGHPLSGENLYVARTGQRVCRTCQTKWQREYRERKKG